ncbi:MAG: glycoside hydrolase family 9 protein [Sphingobacteriales bacterium]|nr:glycoside hydrolase family 9 protein [Sphingobacteriales bacterium]
MKHLLFFLLVSAMGFIKKPVETSWIRVNLLGYKPSGIKVAVWCSKEKLAVDSWQLTDVSTGKVVFTGIFLKSFGAYGPFTETYRINFSSFKKPGRYYFKAGNTISPEFSINENVYDGAADFCLRYMRQQRTGFNPFLKDSCHTHDGYVLYGEKAGIKDSTYVDVVGGWHDASDYLQYATTSANATYHLLMAYRDFPKVFADEKQANGLEGSNGRADVLDEAKWGLDWLLKMHPSDSVMFNQIGDDRDHMGMRIPKEDTNFYGRGVERPVYFLSGEPQQRGKFMNNTTGTSSTAGKFASAFALGSTLFQKENNNYAELLLDKSLSAWDYSRKKEGVTQTASVRSPYIYAEDNWADDMELAMASLYNATGKLAYTSAGIIYADDEKVTPWLGQDTAKHYQWYPFINIGHYELVKQLKGKDRETIIGYYKQGIEKVWYKAKQNAFYRGVPFIWCSNNLTTSFAIQCYWYRQLSKDKSFEELEQANFDWLFGCNPWGTSFVYGLPGNGDTPTDPHSAFTHIRNYPIDGGLVDGPVYGSIYNNLIGIKLYGPDEYADFQSNLVVYHDDYGDYSTNEPTMDGTASLIYLLAAKENELNTKPKKIFLHNYGAIIRGDTTEKKLAVVFTGDEFADGASFITQTLKQQNVKASFFLTGRFYQNPSFKTYIEQLKGDGYYLGPHSGNHLLYCDWNKRDSLLVTKDQFQNDLLYNYDIMSSFGINAANANYFLPPYEWYNDSIAAWTKELGLQLINFTPGTKSNADYTWPELKNYKSSNEIYQSIIDKEKSSGLNGFILLLHIGTGAKRTEKFYKLLPKLLAYLKTKDYQLVKINELLR